MDERINRESNDSANLLARRFSKTPTEVSAKEFEFSLFGIGERSLTKLSAPNETISIPLLMSKVFD